LTISLDYAGSSQYSQALIKAFTMAIWVSGLFAAHAFLDTEDFFLVSEAQISRIGGDNVA
jgi:hypothetical protein